MILTILKHFVFITIFGYYIYNLELKLTTFQIIYLIVSLVIFEYYIYIFYRSFLKYQIRKREFKERKSEEIKLIENFLNDPLEYDDTEKLLKLMLPVKKLDVLPEIKAIYHEQLSKKIGEANMLYEKLEYQQEIQSLERERNSIKNNIDELEQKEKELTQTDEEKREELKEIMKLEENPVFCKEDLSDEELNILLDEDYTYSNEFSLFTNKVESFLIRKTMNHSKTHTFLVWDIMRLLNILEMDKITEHKTIDADITFKYKNKIYAIEVETGTLLKKKKQMKDKIDYLNNKYKDRWLIVVSNRDLLKKYKKIGFSTQRNQVKKTLEKWLNLDT